MKDKKCNYRNSDLICMKGYLWELTYSEMGPPDQRQNTGKKCPQCNHADHEGEIDNRDDEGSQL